MGGLLVRHIGQIATPLGRSAIHGPAMGNLRLYEKAAILVQDGCIAAVGEDAGLGQAVLAAEPDIPVLDAGGGCAVPGFVDPHTHFLFAGARAREFSDRLDGVPYLELLQRGGGICSTMQATRAAS